MSAKIIYREMVGLGWLAGALCCVCIGLIGVAIAAGYPWRGGLVLVGALGLHIAWVLWGIYRMNHIVLTADRLVVGREVFTPRDIDIFFGVQPPLVLRPGEQGRVEEAWPLPPDGDVRIAGGSWGRRIGTATVVLRDARTDQAVAVFSRHPHELSEHLGDWLTAIPDTPAELIDPDTASDS